MKPNLRAPFIPLFAAVALLLHTLLPFYATYQAPQTQDAAKMAAMFGDKVLLCTAEGFRFVSWQELLKNKEQPHQKKYQCAICYVAAHGQGLKPAVTAIASAALSVATAAVPPFLSARFLPERDWQERLTRSPPSILL